MYSSYIPHDRVHPPAGEDDESFVMQSAQAECDINNIMKKYEKTGLLNHVNTYQGNYGDFTDVTDYHSGSLAILAAEEAFESLPAAIRRRFRNDPGEFLDFVGDEENLEEMYEMGLANRPAPILEPAPEMEPTPPESGEPPA